MDVTAITAAIREYNAAENSMRRAHAELVAVLELGVTVLHKTPTDTDSHPMYWTYQRKSDGVLVDCRSRETSFDGLAVIIEAPHKRAEFLPRLDQTKGDAK